MYKEVEHSCVLRGNLFVYIEITALKSEVEN